VIVIDGTSIPSPWSSGSTENAHPFPRPAGPWLRERNLDFTPAILRGAGRLRPCRGRSRRVRQPLIHIMPGTKIRNVGPAPEKLLLVGAAAQMRRGLHADSALTAYAKLDRTGHELDKTTPVLPASSNSRSTIDTHRAAAGHIYHNPCVPDPALDATPSKPDLHRRHHSTNVNAGVDVICPARVRRPAWVEASPSVPPRQRPPIQPAQAPRRAGGATSRNCQHTPYAINPITPAGPDDHGRQPTVQRNSGHAQPIPFSYGRSSLTWFAPPTACVVPHRQHHLEGAPPDRSPTVCDYIDSRPMPPYQPPPRVGTRWRKTDKINTSYYAASPHDRRALQQHRTLRHATRHNPCSGIMPLNADFDLSGTAYKRFVNAWPSPICPVFEVVAVGVAGRPVTAWKAQPFSLCDQGAAQVGRLTGVLGPVRVPHLSTCRHPSKTSTVMMPRRTQPAQGGGGRCPPSVQGWPSAIPARSFSIRL